ncbi:metallophosphoesterase [Thermoactinomyces sp. DSM 45892]|uniref:metallophosphoesterase n=1 Tax=Thermoactinomyces sp. DSM 45892 TaxID=1882753 RepID=UPI00089D4D59|nr:metallophosphoesterase [Thermoactinomyces sp. DSM 45892]SDY00837.1 hypothetical protein SAMN05444416_101225 [Thermoactinomyces sp. DSM 45892]
MAIFSIADLHLSFQRPVDLYEIDPERDIGKPMERFGWDQHYHRIRDLWMERVREEDTVLIPGDISWALRLEEALYDFRWIDQLPGNKVFSPGNHEYYVHSKKKIREALPERMTWLDADFTVVENKIVAATRGWMLPGDYGYQESEDRKIYERQAGRLKMALEAGRKKHSDLPTIVMLHYPPLTQTGKESKFFDLLKEYGVSLCVYGHLHGKAHEDAIEGNVEGVELRLVACDAIQFGPVRIWNDEQKKAETY